MSRRLSTPVTARELAILERAVRHRGPDDVGYLQWNLGADEVSAGRELVGSDSDVGLVHRRLAIIDLSDAGWQPMTASDPQLHVVFNGEIYNYIELREELGRLGCTFRSDSDTEVLLEAYRVWGTDCFARMVGMFALAILDRRTSKLVLARDQFGIKPLYFTYEGGGFAFASEIKALLALPRVSRQVDAHAAYRYLRFGQTDGRDDTLFSTIRQLPAAHYVEVSLDSSTAPTAYRYWALTPRPLGLSYEEAVREVRGAFLHSVGLHLRSDVPVGAALSGGIDSSAIVTLMRRIGGDQVDINAFTWITPGNPIDESGWARLVAQQVSAQQITVSGTAHELAAGIDELIRIQDEPFGSTSIFAQHRLFQAVGEKGVKVMLDGQGADELLGGYRAHIGARTASLLARGHIIRAARQVRSAMLLPGDYGLTGIAKHVGRELLPSALHAAAARASGDGLMLKWMNGEWFADRGVLAALPERAAVSQRNYLNRALLTDVAATSLPALLRYEDRNSMAFSVESRVPFLTTEFAELVCSLPEHYIIGLDGTTKRVFRSAMRETVPDAILNRRDKVGFSTPEASWLAELRPWAAEVVATHAIPALRHTAVHTHMNDVFDGRRQFDSHVWRLLNLIRWSSIHAVEWN